MEKRNRYTVIKDTREKNGWYFFESEKCAGMKERKLDTGDYSIEGLEDKVCIERKASVTELATNITQKRFDNELQRMILIPVRHLVLEFSMEDILGYPHNLKLKPELIAKIRIGPKFIQSCLRRYEEQLGITVVFAGSKLKAFQHAREILEKVYYENQRTDC
jgi:ERCC4-type nuclease